MPPITPATVEATRQSAARMQAAVLQRLARVTQERAAACMGVSASTVSRAITDDLLRICEVMAACGLRVAEAGAVVMEPSEIRALKQMAVKYLQAELDQDGGCGAAEAQP